MSGWTFKMAAGLLAGQIILVTPQSMAQDTGRARVKMDELDVTIDLATAERSAGRIKRMLGELRTKHDLAPFEYTRKIRIAPLERPHSSPVLTLNGAARTSDDVLATYLHEQLHWYAVWFAIREPERWQLLFAELRKRYPDAPVGGAEGAHNVQASYLHLIVNLMELEALAEYIGRPAAEAALGTRQFYRWMYRIVLSDQQALAELYKSVGLFPIRKATEFSREELETLGARVSKMRVFEDKQ